MAFRDWMHRWFTGHSHRHSFDLKSFCFGIERKIFYKKLAINASINLIANSLSRAKFRTYVKGEEKRSDNFYLFNVQPNINQSATEFFHQLISRLVMDNEALVIMQDKQLFIADDWNCEEFALKENIYTDVVIKDYKLNKTFMESDVFHFRLNDERMISIIDGMYEDYGKLISSGVSNYKRANTLRAVLNIDSNGPQTDEEQEALEDLFNNQMKEFFDADGGAVLPLYDGLDLEEVFQDSKGNKESRDIRSLVDDIFDFVAMGFNIPKVLLKGDVAEVENQTNNFLTFCMSPIAE